MKYKRARGTQDIYAPEVEVWRNVEAVFDHTFVQFGFNMIRTPIFEPTDLFTRSVGEGSDIVTREMYTFEDRGGRSLTLRPENTASVIRAYLEAGMHRSGGVARLAYLGPMFRYDRPQAGRFRQFHQVGAETIGSDSPAVDVELIHVVVSALRELGFDDLELRINSVGTAASRGPYQEVLRQAIDKLAEVSMETRDRYRDNPLRIFDAKEVPAAIKQKLPLISDHLVEEDRKHFAAVMKLLDETGIVHIHDTQLVRGLDYYTRTVFEIYCGDLGAQSALCGGGRYDNLVEECGGPATPAIGFSVGLERVIAALPESSIARRQSDIPVFVVACVDAASSGRALRLARAVRSTSINARVETDLSGRSKKKQIQVAEKRGARAVFVLEDEKIEAYDCRTHDMIPVNEETLSEYIEGLKE